MADDATARRERNDREWDKAENDRLLFGAGFALIESDAVRYVPLDEAERLGLIDPVRRERR